MSIWKIARRLFVFMFIALACSAFIASCSRNLGVGNLHKERMSLKEAAPGQVPQSAHEEAKTAGGGLSAAANSAVARKEIITGELFLEVKSVEESARLVEKIIERAGGYISNSNYNTAGDGQARTYTMTLRAPSGKFGGAVYEIKALGETLKNSMKRDDVTEEYIDVTARLKNLQAQEQRYQEIMKKANTIAEIFSVEEQLGKVRGEIESLAGRAKYLDNQSEFSTLSLTLSEKQPPVAVKKWKVLDSFSAAWQAFIVVLKGLADIAAWLIVFSPLLIALALIVCGFAFFGKRKRKGGN